VYRYHVPPFVAMPREMDLEPALEQGLRMAGAGAA
jgi:hypothetical protein